MTGLPLEGLTFHKRVTKWVPTGEVYVMQPKPGILEYIVMSREPISDMAAVSYINSFIARNEEVRYESECAAFWLEGYSNFTGFPPDEALGRAGADE